MRPGARHWRIVSGRAVRNRGAARRTALAARAARAGDRRVHDAADSARATPALGAAAEAAIDLAGRARRLLGAERGAHVLVGQHVAGADDHGKGGALNRF